MGVSCDVAIAGGGIVGAACAEACAAAGLSVTVAEPDVVGGGATAAGMGHIVVMDDSPAQLALTRYSRQLWIERAGELAPDVEYLPCGTIWVAADEEEMAEVRRKKRICDQAGVAGAGPAGLGAARSAASCGASVLLVDDNPKPGGQIWRGDDRRWRGTLEGPIRVLSGARIVDFPRAAAATLETAEESCEVSYRGLVLATGARERFLPFPGWTLPNVTGAGGLQALAKSGLAAVARRRVVVAGSGPLLPAVAQYLRERGARIRLIAEQAELSSLVRFGLALAGHPSKLVQALRLRPAKYLTDCWPVAAHGKDKLEAVTLRRGGRTWDEPCDYLACGFGLIPNTELAALAGCRVGPQGVLVDEHQQTSVPGVWCAGEATGIGGADLALVEGEIAGFAAAGRPGKAARLFAARARHRRFAGALERAFALRPELRSLPRPDTLVCRCEDVSWGRIRECAGWREAKLYTRCGMGPCQGRVCGGALEFLLGWPAGPVRPPVFPARIGSLSRPRYPQP